MRRSVKVLPRGRLGNQLFQACVALQLADSTEVRNRVRWEVVAQHDSLLRSTSLFPFEFRSWPRPVEAALSLADRVDPRISGALRESRRRRIRSSGLSVPDLGPINFADLQDQDTQLIVEGFYQHYLNVQPQLPRLRRALLEQVPMSLVNHLRALRPIAIHVRLGDFLNREVRRGTGILGASYYANAVRMIEEETGPGQPLLIFSDDPERARQVLQPLRVTGECRVITANEFELEDRLELILMAQCQGLVLSNSSFSWWAGYLAMPGVRVICPSPLRRDQEWAGARSPDWIPVDAAYY